MSEVEAAGAPLVLTMDFGAGGVQEFNARAERFAELIDTGNYKIVARREGGGVSAAEVATYTFRRKSAAERAEHPEGGRYTVAVNIQDTSEAFGKTQTTLNHFAAERYIRGLLHLLSVGFVWTAEAIDPEEQRT